MNESDRRLAIHSEIEDLVYADDHERAATQRTLADLVAGTLEPTKAPTC